jgi:hypothetical protein
MAPHELRPERCFQRRNRDHVVVHHRLRLPALDHFQRACVGEKNRPEILDAILVFDSKLIHAVERVDVLPLDIDGPDVVGAQLENAAVHLLDLAGHAIAVLDEDEVGFLARVRAEPRGRGRHGHQSANANRRMNIALDFLAPRAGN